MEKYDVILRYRFKGGNGTFRNIIDAKSAEDAFHKAITEINTLIKSPILYEIIVEER